MINKPLKNITELEAATHCVEHVLKKTLDTWPKLYKSLQETFGNDFVVRDEIIAAFDLSLAAIAFDMQAVKNLFPKEQADRIKGYILESVNSDQWGEYATEEVENYDKKFQQDLKNGDPIGSIPSRLLQRLLGENIHKFTVNIGGKDSGIISPLLIMTMEAQLVAFVGNWKKIKDNFEIIQN